MKLVRSGRIATQDVRGDNFVYATALSVVPSDTSRFLVGSTDGRLLHQSRFPSNVLSPRAFSPFDDMEDADETRAVAGSSGEAVLRADFSPFHPALALVTMSGGRILLYDTDESPAPISEWMQPPTLREAVWSRTRPTVFFSVSEDTVCAWDISVDLVRPVGTMRPARGTGMMVDFALCAAKQNVSGAPTHFITAYDSGDVILHEISAPLSEPRAGEDSIEEALLR